MERLLKEKWIKIALMIIVFTLIGVFVYQNITISNLKEDLNNCENRNYELESRCNELEDNVDELEDNVDELESKLRNCKNSLFFENIFY